MKRLGIMQPYFFPYIGYFKLINLCDEFIVYDNIKYTKKGWINRNNILINNKQKLFSISLSKDSDFLNINQRKVSPSFEPYKILNLITNSYKKTPEFQLIYPIIERCFNYKSKNLFDYIFYSIVEICSYLDIDTKLHISSEINIDHSLKSSDKVISFCNKLNAQEYINPIGGIGLYDKEFFKEKGVELFFLENVSLRSPSSNIILEPLSIIDDMMHLSKSNIQEILMQDYILK